jgi:predicted outer membrane repeat protein
VTNSNDSGPGSLRQTIADAGSGDTIVFDASVVTITLTSGELTVDKGLIIDGNDTVTIDADNASRAFNINDSTASLVDVSLNGLIIKNGNSTAEGGAILNQERLTVSQSTITENTAGTNGGAIFNSANAELTVNESLFTGNTAATNGGAIYNNNGTLTVQEASFASNTAADGGACYNYGGTTTLTDSTLSANNANSDGGALFAYMGSVTLTNCTVSGNTAVTYGGGIYAGRSQYSTTLNINNSTIARNSTNNSGGGIYLYWTTLNISSSIAGNNAAGAGPDLAMGSHTTINADHTLVATTEGHTLTDGVDNNIIGYDPLLFSLGDYGGPTLTHTLKDTSPCINAGANPQALVTDQRGTGFPRESGTIDMGAVEYAANTQLTVTKTGNSTGTVTATPGAIDCGPTCSDLYDPNTTVTLTAVADAETTFAGWTGDCASAGTNTTCTITMESARSVTATFNWKTYTLSVSQDGTGTGTVTSSPTGIDCGSDCSESYIYNTAVTLTATADTGSTFTSWSGACTGSTPVCDVTMNQAAAVTATFTLNRYTVTANAEGTGTGSVTSDVGGISYTYPTTTGTASDLNHGSSITLTASADVGSTVSWTGCATTGGSATEATCTFPALDGDKTVTATFTLNQYTVTANAEGTGTGSVTSDVGGISYTYPATTTGTASDLDHGSSITLTAAADSGYTASWSGCSSTGGTDTIATCTFPALDGDKTVTATFSPAVFTLSLSIEGTGTGTVTSSPVGIDCGTQCSAGFDYGTVVTLTATPGEKSRFKGWSGACSGTETTCDVTITDDLEVGVRFDNGFPWTMFLPAILQNK